MYAIDIISNLSILAPTLMGAFLFSKLDKPLKTLYLLVLVTFVLELIVLYTSWQGWNNLFLFNIHTWIEFGIISAFYFQLMRMVFFRRLLLLTVFLFMVYSIFNYFLWEPFGEFNSNQRTVEAVVVVFFLLYYSIYLMQTLELRSLETHPYFWATISFLFYFMGTFLLFMFSRLYIEENIQSYWYLHGVCNIFLNGMLAVVFLMGRKGLNAEC